MMASQPSPCSGALSGMSGARYPGCTCMMICAAVWAQMCRCEACLDDQRRRGLQRLTRLSRVNRKVMKRECVVAVQRSSSI